MYIYIYVCMYVCMYMCVCVSTYQEDGAIKSWLYRGCTVLLVLTRACCMGRATLQLNK